MFFCYLIGVSFVVIIALYLCLELHYFMRTLLSVVLARFFKERIPILQETTVKGICVTTDIDTFLSHMNNARFMRELDFARIDFYERTGFYKCIKQKKGSLALGATTIRYRRFIRLFHRYMITSKIIYWDDQGIYMEHRFISPRDNFINAIAICKTRLLNCTVEEVMNELLTKSQKKDSSVETKVRPEMTPELAKWIESNEISSATLRNPC